ncbi:MAG: hypothetical protein AB1599_10195 [Planctomycetota bacterium]
MYKKYILPVLLLSAVLVLSITCAGRTSKPDIKPALPELPVNMKQCQEIVERISDRKFKSDVRAKVQSAAEFRNFVRADLDKSLGGNAKWEQMALSKLGLLPEGYDLRQGLENLLVSQAGAYYDPPSKTMYFVKLNMPKTMLETTVIHELTHALQDQHYDLEKLIKTADNNDRETAVRYLMEGEASYVMNIAQMEQMRMTFTPDSPVLEMALNRAGNLGRRPLMEMTMSQAEEYKETAPDIYDALTAIKDAPDYLFWILTAPYIRGAYSIHTIVATDGKSRNWKAIDNVYANPPVSTEQMIHPAKLAEPRDNPEPVAPPKLGEEWTMLTENTLGELGFWILFSNYTETRANEASEGWDGDKYFLLQHNKTKDIVLYLSTVWDSDNDSYESFNAYQKVLAGRYPSAQIQKENGSGKITYTLSDSSRIVLTMKNNAWTAEELPSGTK